MNIPLGVRTLVLLAVVAAATAILVHPGFVRTGAAPDPALGIAPTLGHA